MTPKQKKIVDYFINKENERLGIIPGKDPKRVHKGYKVGSDDWRAQYNMLLMDGKTCSDCIRCEKCCTLFGSKPTNTSCEWYPSRVIYKKDVPLRTDN